MNCLSEPLRCLAGVAPNLVDDTFGVIRYVRECPHDAGSPNFFQFYARACDTRGFCAQPNSADGGGASVDREKALAKAIGEAVERYCSAIYQREDFPLCSFNSAPFPCVSPDQFALYGQKQYAKRNFPFVPFENKTLVRWASALDLTTGETCHIPAAKVFVPYFFDKECGELPILQPISTGLACHVGPFRAAVSAVCEVIERDAFTITWQARMGRAKIATETLSKANINIAKRFEGMGRKVSLFNLTMDHGVPVILAVLRSTELDAPAMVFGLGSELNPENAIRKSLEELALCYRYCRLLKEAERRFIPSSDFMNVTDRDGHVAVYCNHANLHLADFLFESSQCIDCSEIENLATGDPKHDLAILVNRLSAINHHVLLADVTTADVHSLGLSVMRAIIPGFHPLAIGHHIRALGGRRLWEIPQQLGYKGIVKSTGDNPAPHPLP